MVPPLFANSARALVVVTLSPDENAVTAPASVRLHRDRIDARRPGDAAERDRPARAVADVHDPAGRLADGRGRQVDTAVPAVDERRRAAARASDGAGQGDRTRVVEQAQARARPARRDRDARDARRRRARPFRRTPRCSPPPR